MATKEKKDLNGLAGWLLLVGFGLIIAVPRAIAAAARDFGPIFEDGVWKLLTTPGSGSFLPHFETIASLEIMLTIGFLALVIYTIKLYFSKSHKFPAFYIGVWLFTVFTNIFSTVGNSILSSEPVMTDQNLIPIVAAAIMAGIWIWYMRVSKRVEATFIN